jgi:hypothetical protein
LGRSKANFEISPQYPAYIFKDVEVFFLGFFTVHVYLPLQAGPFYTVHTDATFKGTLA